MELLLLSNSTMPGEPFLQWPRPYLTAFLEGRRTIAFIPYAAPEQQQDAYADKVAAAFQEMGMDLFSLHREAEPVKSLDRADAVAVGGGNTFLLLRTLYRTGLIRAIADRVRNGMPYAGWSAGSNVACPTIMTTNDMPIVETPSLKAMHLVPFQINPHYTEATIPDHGGESRDQRIAEFHAMNPGMPVIGLREGALLHISDDGVRSEGRGLKLFRAGTMPKEYPGSNMFKLSLQGA